MTRNALQKFFDWLARRSIPPSPGVEDSIRDARQAQIVAQGERARMEARGKEVSEVSAELRKAREANHFGQRLQVSFGLRGQR